MQGLHFIWINSVLRQLKIGISVSTFKMSCILTLPKTITQFLGAKHNINHGEKFIIMDKYRKSSKDSATIFFTFSILVFIGETIISFILYTTKARQIFDTSNQSPLSKDFESGLKLKIGVVGFLI